MGTDFGAFLTEGLLLSQTFSCFPLLNLFFLLTPFKICFSCFPLLNLFFFLLTEAAHVPHISGQAFFSFLEIYILQFCSYIVCSLRNFFLRNVHVAVVFLHFFFFSLLTEASVPSHLRSSICLVLFR